MHHHDPQEGSSGGARRQVDHTVSGPPEPASRYPFWDWDPASRGQRARLAIPDVGPLCVGASIEAEYEALLYFIDTKCAPILRGIGPDTAVRPAELETYEIARQIFDERILFHVKHSLAHVRNFLFHVKQNLHWPSEPHSGTRGASRAALAMRKRRGIRALRHALGA